MRILTISLVILLFIPAMAFAVVWPSAGNPADLFHPLAYLENPCLALLQNAQAAVGFKLMHVGVLSQPTSINSSYFVASGFSPIRSASFSARYLRTPMWSEQEFSVGYGRGIFRGFALGLKVGIHQEGFNRSEFDLDVSDDPALSGRLSAIAPVASIGLLYSSPFRGLTVGAVVENPHRPGISINGKDKNVRIPMQILTGLMIERRGVELTLEGGQSAEQRLLRFGGRYYLMGTEHALLGWVSNQGWSAGLRMSVLGGLTLDYRYEEPFSDLAKASAGTHSINLWFRSFGVIRSIQRYVHRPTLSDAYIVRVEKPVGREIPEASPVTMPQLASKMDLYYVSAEHDTLGIKQKLLQRVGLGNVPRDKLKLFPRYYVGVLDSSWSNHVLLEPIDRTPSSIPITGLRKGRYSEEYKTWIDSLIISFFERGLGKVTIICSEDEIDRGKYIAEEIGRRLHRKADDVALIRVVPSKDRGMAQELFEKIGVSEIPGQEELVILEKDQVPFSVHFLGEDKDISGWWLEIRGSEGDVIKNLTGKGAPPDTIWWDWCGEDGKLVGPDIYNYRFSWVRNDGAHLALPPREFMVCKNVLETTLKFGMEALKLEDLGYSDVGIYLDTGHRGHTILKDRRRKSQEPSSNGRR